MSETINYLLNNIPVSFSIGMLAIVAIGLLYHKLNPFDKVRKTFKQ